jgi:hypothetical protein
MLFLCLVGLMTGDFSTLTPAMIMFFSSDDMVSILAVGTVR